MPEAEKIQDANNIGVAKGRPGGYAVVAPAGTDLAKFKDVAKTLKELIAEMAASGVKSLGYISSDGITWSTDVDSEDNNDWGGDVIDSTMNSYSESAKVTFLETRDSVLKTVYGDGNVTTENGVTEVRHNSNFTAPHAFVFDNIISPTKVKRCIVPLGRIFERDDLTQNNSDLLGYSPTIKAMACDAYDGDTYREYIYDFAAATQASADEGKPVAD